MSARAKVVLPAPLHPLSYAAAFMLFRIFDIWKPWPVGWADRRVHGGLGIMLDESNPARSRCIRCETCDGFPCLIHAKSDAQVICVDPALAHPNVTLLTNAKVTRLVTSPSGREVTAVAVLKIPKSPGPR